MADDAGFSNSSTGSAPIWDWAGENARRWASQADRLDAQLAPVSEILFRSAALYSGATVLDIGCGRGATTREAAGIVGLAGTVVGLDISDALLSEARTAATDIANIEFVLADAQTYSFEPQQFEIAISRFGVMFFADSVAAFKNLHGAMRSGGRLFAAVWQPRDRSELMDAPLQLGARIIAEHGHVVELPAANGGPFSLGEFETIERVLGAAGWSNITATPHELSFYNGGPGTVDDAVVLALTIGPLRLLLNDLPAEVEAAVRAALVEDFTKRHDGTGVVLRGSIFIVSATA